MSSLQRYVWLASLVVILSACGAVGKQSVSVLGLTLTGPSSVRENAGTAKLTLIRSGGTDEQIVVSLASSNPGALTVPASVTLNAGQASAEIEMAIVDNLDDAGDTQVVVSATGAGVSAQPLSILVLDNDPEFSITTPAATIREDVGTITVTVTRTVSLGDQVISLSSSNPALATVPAQIIIPNGSLEVSATVTVIDDLLVNGTRELTITADLSGDTRSVVLSVEDDEPRVALSVSPSVVAEDAGSATLTVSILGGATQDYVVLLGSSDPSSITVPASVTVPSGSASVITPITIIDDAVADGNVDVTISAVSGSLSGTVVVTVQDDDATFSLQAIPAELSENGGTATLLIARTGLDSDLSTALIVALAYAPTDELSGPTTVTIPAGQPSTSVSLVGVDDSIDDGDVNVTITASSAGYLDGIVVVKVLDNEDAIQLTATKPSFGEPGDSVIVQITRSSVAVASTVNLSLSDPDRASVQSSVTFGPTQLTASVIVSAINNAIEDGDVTLNIVASDANPNSGIFDGTISLDLIDDEGDGLTSRKNTIQGALTLEGSVLPAIPVELRYKGALWGTMKTNSAGKYQFNNVWGDLRDLSVHVGP